MSAPNHIHLWRNACLFAAVLYLKVVAYASIYYQGFSIVPLSEALAFTAGVLIGASFVLSSLTYFFNFMDSKLKYRKQLGLLGYYLAFAYSLSLFFRNLDLYWTHWDTAYTQPQAILGLAAMAILTMMAIISGNWAIERLGQSWRPLLRTGYIAYLLLIIRALIVEGDSWRAWMQTPTTVAPPRLILTIFALMVLYSRVGLEIALRFKKKASVTQQR